MSNNNEGINGFIDLNNSFNDNEDRFLVNIKSTSSSLSIISASAVANNSTHSPVAVEDWKESSNVPKTKIPVVPNDFIAKNNVGLMDDESAFYSNQSIPWNVDHREQPTATAGIMLIETVLFSKGDSWSEDKTATNDYVSRGIISASARDASNNYEYDNKDDESYATHHSTSFRERYEMKKTENNFRSNRTKAAFSKADVVMDDYELYKFKR